VTPILFFLLPLVIVLYLLILSMNHGRHYAPQAYHRKASRGANYVLGLASLVARSRREHPKPTRRRWL
jgi:hypothetical protein